MDVNPICEQKCAKYSYWWSYKASFLSQERFKLDKCVRKCVKDFNNEFILLFLNNLTDLGLNFFISLGPVGQSLEIIGFSKIPVSSNIFGIPSNLEGRRNKSDCFII